MDSLFLFRSSSPYFKSPYSEKIVHLDITDSSIERLGTFYLNRSHYAQVIRNLAEMDVAAILYDFIFATPRTEKEDRELINAAKQAECVYFGMAFRLKEAGKSLPILPQKESIINLAKKRYLDITKWHLNTKGDGDEIYRGANGIMTFPELASVSRGLGFLNLNVDRDGIYRRMPLVVRYNGDFYPSFAFRAICDYLSVGPEQIIVKPGVSITLKGAKKPGHSSINNIVIPIDRQGNMLVDFIGPWERLKHYNFVDVLLASTEHELLKLWKDELSGKIVVVSEVKTGSADIGPVPTDSLFPLSALHSYTMHTILTESFYHELSYWNIFLIEILLLVTIFMLSSRFSSVYFSVGAFCLAIFYLASVSALFLFGHIIANIIRPLLVIGFSSLSIVVYRYISEERERDFIRATFSRYLSDEVVDELLESPGGLEMSGEIKEVTFMVSDIRGFTSLSARLSPPVTIDIINRYLEHMLEIVSKYRGTVNEIEGDGILVFFGAPIDAEDDDERAVACAIEMQNEMVNFNKEQRQRQLPELGIGIGINRGEVVVGNIGSQKRAKYSAIGSALNTAYRIESHTVGGQILIGPSIYENIGSRLNIRGTIRAHFKGLTEPMSLYDVAEIKGKYNITLQKKRHEEYATLNPPLSIRCFPLKGKTISDTPIHGQIIRLGQFSAEISLEEELNEHTNVLIKIDLAEERQLSEIYAKVISFKKPQSSNLKNKIGIEFTWIPEDVKTFLNE
jgi:adenylate cyclase